MHSRQTTPLPTTRSPSAKPHSLPENPPSTHRRRTSSLPRQQLPHSRNPLAERGSLAHLHASVRGDRSASRAPWCWSRGCRAVRPHIRPLLLGSFHTTPEAPEHEQRRQWLARLVWRVASKAHAERNRERSVKSFESDGQLTSCTTPSREPQLAARRVRGPPSEPPPPSGSGSERRAKSTGCPAPRSPGERAVRPDDLQSAAARSKGLRLRHLGEEAAARAEPFISRHLARCDSPPHIPSTLGRAPSACSRGNGAFPLPPRTNGAYPARNEGLSGSAIIEGSSGQQRDG